MNIPLRRRARAGDFSMGQGGNNDGVIICGAQGKQLTWQLIQESIRPGHPTAACSPCFSTAVILERWLPLRFRQRYRD